MRHWKYVHPKIYCNMKTKEQTKEKEFDTVKTFREIKEKISMELIGKSAQQIKDYLRTNSLKLYV